jgi:hypothetical protein
MIVLKNAGMRVLKTREFQQGILVSSWRFSVAGASIYPYQELHEDTHTVLETRLSQTLMPVLDTV